MAFTTEFGAVLAPGESFGWRGFTGAAQGEDDDEQVQQQQEADDDSPRLVRIQRLYSGRSAFVSGTTSLLTAM